MKRIEIHLFFLSPQRAASESSTKIKIIARFSRKGTSERTEYTKVAEITVMEMIKKPLRQDLINKPRTCKNNAVKNSIII